MFIEEIRSSLLLNNNFYDNHAKVLKFNDSKAGLLGFIALHRLKKNKPSFGATRILDYSSEYLALNDVLRLSKLMSYKSAIADLPYGGAKAVIIANKEWVKSKNKLLASYAEIINKLNGLFITGSDVGLIKEDVVYMKKICKYFVGVNNDPSFFTSLGLYYSILVVVKEVYDRSNLKNISIAIQGLGKVGFDLLGMVYKEGANIFVSDIDNFKVTLAKSKYPNINVVNTNDIYSLNVDVFSPCALNSCLNQKTIRELKCKIIIGGANNQLENNSIAKNLHEKRIVYCPDYLVNSGGLISVVDEYSNNNLNVYRISKNITRIPLILREIIKKSNKTNKTPLSIADEISQKLINKDLG